jgi:RNA polymerase sigma-70 factor (ECF subfamily)
MDVETLSIAQLRLSSLSDGEIVARVRAGETALFEILMRRHNQRVYRVARAVLKDETEAEDAMQQAYINAFRHLDQFAERAQFSTWLTRIAVHEALARRRQRKVQAAIAPADGAAHGELMDTLAAREPDPERQAYTAELGHLLESAVDALPETYRIVFMLREIEGLSTSETAEGLALGEEAVKTRLHRARAMLRRTIAERLGAAGAQAFQFHASRCDRVVAAVFAQIAAASCITPSTGLF